MTSSISLMAVLFALIEVDLSGMWKLEGEGAAREKVNCPVRVPGGIHSALFEAGLMPDPFWGRNEAGIQEIGRRTWTVSRTFEVADALLRRKAIVLRLENVDTYATILLNGYELGKTDNRFRRWEYDIKPYLRKGANELRGVFASAERTEDAKAKTW